MADKQLWQVDPQANDVKNDDGVIIGGQTAGTRYAPLTLIANFVHSLWAAFVHACAAITSFASGDTFSVSNPTDGTRKMSKDTLLQLTAQNVLNGNVCNEFKDDINYSFGDKVIDKGGLKRALKSITAGDYDPSEWELKNIFNVCKFIITAGNLQYLNDLDNYPLDSSVVCASNAFLSSIANKPVSTQFVCYTFKTDNSSVIIQVFVSEDGKQIYFRRKWGSWGAWKQISTVNHYGINSGNLTSYNDLDNYPLDSSVRCGSNTFLSSIANKPVSTQFIVYTFGTDVANTAWQIFVSESGGRVFYRRKWGSWSAWNEIATIKKITVTNDNLANYNDLDNYPAWSSIICMSSSLLASISNLPSSTQFIAYTFGTERNDVLWQVFVSEDGTGLYFRRRWGNSWSVWSKVSTETNAESEAVNPLAAFDNFVCIGDSLTYCQVYTSQNTSRQAKKTWGEILAHNCDADVQIIAHAGDSAIDSWIRVDSDLESKTNALAIVYLGTNEGLTDTLDTDAPVDAPYTDWADTNTGCYAKIVAKAQSLGYKVLLIKPWSAPNLSTTQKVVDDVGTRFGCCVIGPFYTSEVMYHYYPDLSGYDGLHYNDLGYAWFGTVLPYNVSKASSNNVKYIIPS